MTYLLDTDYLSILQRQTGADDRHLSKCMASVPITDFAVSIITFHEQVLGCHAYINRRRSMDQIVKGYALLTRLLSDFQRRFDFQDEQTKKICPVDQTLE